MVIDIFAGLLPYIDFLLPGIRLKGAMRASRYR